MKRPVDGWRLVASCAIGSPTKYSVLVCLAHFQTGRPLRLKLSLDESGTALAALADRMVSRSQHQETREDTAAAPNRVVLPRRGEVK